MTKAAFWTKAQSLVLFPLSLMNYFVNSLQDEIKARLGQLHDHWNQLKEKSTQRKQDLFDSLQAHQYFADANEAESWIKEKETLAGYADFGKDEDASEALLKRHEAFMSDLAA